MKKALIDADTIAYRSVFAQGSDTVGGCIEKINDILDNIFHSVEYHLNTNKVEYTLFLTGSNNFRKKIDETYKGQRPKEKPVMLNFARHYIHEEYPTVITEGEEADDAIAIVATANYPNAVIVSIDKDFRQVPCTLYNPAKETWEEIDEWNGLLFFYQQMLVGDTADNIKGVNKVGPVKAAKLLDGATTEQELWNRCVEAYEGDVERAIKNGRLLWLRRYENQIWEPPKS